MTTAQNRCRVILGVHPGLASPDSVINAASGGDVATVILHAGDSSETVFAEFCQSLVPRIQALDIAVLIADDTQVAGRTECDGLFLEKTRNELADVIARFSPQKIVGCGGMMDRHNALRIGELGPDFVLFGKLGSDVKEAAHPKNLALGEWWAAIVEVPAVVPCGSGLDTVIDVANTGVEFVLCQKSVFENDLTPMEAVAKANALLDEFAPELIEADA